MSHRNLLGPEVKVLIFSPDVCVLGLQGTWASACSCPQGVLATFLTSVPCRGHRSLLAPPTVTSASPDSSPVFRLTFQHMYFKFFHVVMTRPIPLGAPAYGSCFPDA